MKTGAIIVLLCSAAIAWSQGRILIGPNVQVSRDGDVAHVESHVGVNPTNPRNLLGTAISFTSPAIGTETKVYASFDGGWTWTDRYFPDQRQQGAFDPQVAFGPTGTAYFVTLVFTSDSKTYDAVAFYRSEDGGLTWSNPVHLGFNYDRNAITVDNTHGRFRGRVYVVSHDVSKDPMEAQLFRSSDDGRTFEGPVSTNCKTVHHLLILSDGTFLVPCVSTDMPNNPAGFFGGAISVDGGETLTTFMGSRIDPERFQGVDGWRVYAVDTTSGFRDRIYALWLREDVKRRSQEIISSYSTDRGRNWSSPRAVAPLSKNNAKQFLPMAVVNKKGVLGVIWFEAYPPDYDTYDWFFTASLDGGVTFLPPRRVTSQSSRPDSPGNRTITQLGGIRKDGESSFLTAYSSWERAGHYTGLTTDSDGVFYAFWPDARRGAFQLYTSRIAVEESPFPVSSDVANPERTVDEEVRLEYGPPIQSCVGCDDVILVCCF